MRSDQASMDYNSLWGKFTSSLFCNNFMDKAFDILDPVHKIAHRFISRHFYVRGSNDGTVF